MSDAELHELEEVACPGAGACGGQFTANTMAMAFEFLGISPRARRWSRPRTTQGDVAEQCGELVMEVLAEDIRPQRRDHQGALENAIARWLDRAARPTPCCT